MKQITCWIVSSCWIVSLCIFGSVSYVMADEPSTESYGVTMDFNIKSVEGAPYHHYAWLANSTIINDPTGEWEPADYDIGKYLTELVDQQFMAKGYSKADKKDAEPDLGLMYFAGINVRDAELDDDLKQSVSEHVVKGALVFVVTDLALGKPVMVVSASVTTDTMKAEVDIAKARIRYVAESLLQPFPRSGELFVE